MTSFALFAFVALALLAVWIALETLVRPRLPRSRKLFNAFRSINLPDRWLIAVIPPMAGAQVAQRTQGAHAEGAGSTPATAAQRSIPFHQASHKAWEPAFTKEITPGTGAVTVGPEPLPAQGYLDKVVIDLESAGGSEGSATVGKDFPFNIFTLIRLQDSNSATITELSGFNMLLAMTYGGFAGCPDPRNYPNYSAGKVTPRFTLKLPVGLNPMGLGVLANQSSSSAFKLTYTVAAKTEIWGTQPTTIPALKIRISTELMTLPPAADSLGRPQQQVPPYNGTAQYFRVQPNVSVSAGNNNTRVTDTGNMLRMLIFIARKTGERSEEPFPDPFNLVWDTGYLMIGTRQLMRVWMRELIEQLAERDTGVFAFNWSYGTHRHAGENELNALIPTVTATRLEATGASAEAGTLDIFTNTVSIAEVNPALRPVQRNATGYQPPTPPANPMGQ